MTYYPQHRVIRDGWRPTVALSLLMADRKPEPEEDTELLWQEQAVCASTDPEMFFPEKGGSTREAKQICTRCQVRDRCLEYALQNEERFGIWGGMSERERRKIIYARRGKKMSYLTDVDHEKSLTEGTA